MALAAAERRAGKYLSLSLTAPQGRARQRYFPALRSGFGSSRARYGKADKKFVCRPFWGGTFCVGPVGAAPLLRGTLGSAFVFYCLMGCFGMGKKSRARVAATGTRKDPERRVVEGGDAKRADKEKKVGAHAHPEWAPHLNTASEDLTAKLFTLVEVILGVVPVVVIGLFLASKDATSVDKLTDVFSQDPSMVVTFISACLQPFVAYMLYMIYRKYCEGDAGFAAGNLIGLLCSEILLLNVPGVIGIGILLWRVWRNVAPHFGSWLFERRAMGVLVDIAGSLVILALAFMCATAARGLAGM